MSNSLDSTPIEKEPTKESLTLAQNLIKLVYEGCADGWYSENNPEDLALRFREVPKHPALKTKKPLPYPSEWRVVVQRDPDDKAATIFYSGQIAKTPEFYNHQRGLKIIHADPKMGISLGFYDKIETPSANEWLAKKIEKWTTKEGGNWRNLLVPYDKLLTGDRATLRSLTEASTPSGLFNAVRVDFLVRSLAVGGEFLGNL